jgi:hypothetical protein
MKTYEERREEQRRYESDVNYEVWRSGGNMDRINPDRVDNAYWNGDSAESAARCELRRQRPEPEYDESQQWPEQEWPDPS